MTEKKHDLPRTYAIWAEARPDSPMAGLSGFLSENSRRLLFSDRDEAERKIKDLHNLHLNRHPAAEYDNAEQWRALLSSQAMQMAEAMKIPWDQFRWYAAYGTGSQRGRRMVQPLRR